VWRLPSGEGKSLQRGTGTAAFVPFDQNEAAMRLGAAGLEQVRT